MRTYCVYIMASISRTLYVGVTNDLERRVREHKEGLIEGFTRKYRIKKLVYYETLNTPRDAIAREKQIKGWRRARKVELIESVNPTWKDLAHEWSHPPRAPRPSNRPQLAKPTVILSEVERSEGPFGGQSVRNDEKPTGKSRIAS